mmetsp:Transcript_13054/g.24933  ORF Transcript_13054/g.24933 Transcript_13054/m.24933 type:complete len:215 (-) Transcript_13054:876-1520(-)
MLLGLQFRSLFPLHLAAGLAPRIYPFRIPLPPKGMASHAEGISPDNVLKFWFEDLSPADWFKSDAALDATIRDKFQVTLERASACELSGWRVDANGALAEIIVLDQFSRNIYRNTRQAFAQDGTALALAQEAISKGFEQNLDPQEKSFLYMPFMHSESSVIHDRAMELFQAPGLEEELGHEKQHAAMIDRFGRYPYRNEILGRESTPEEENTFL